MVNDQDGPSADLVDRAMIDRMPEPARITVALRILGDTLCPDEVTRLVDAQIR